MSQAVRRLKRSHAPVTPTSLSSMIIPEELKLTHDFESLLSTQKSNLPFLLADSGQNEKRTLVFGTDTTIRLLEESVDWHADATFDVVPSLFRQLFTLHARLPDSRITVPCLYVLLTGKSIEDYVQMLQMVCFYSFERRSN